MIVINDYYANGLAFSLEVSCFKTQSCNLTLRRSNKDVCARIRLCPAGLAMDGQKDGRPSSAMGSEGEALDEDDDDDDEEGGADTEEQSGNESEMNEPEEEVIMSIFYSWASDHSLHV